MTFTPVTVTATYTNADGSVPTGTVTFTPTAVMANGGALVPVYPRMITLANGTATVVLDANDDAGTTPTGTGYRVVETLDASATRTFNIILSAGTPNVNLATLAPATTTALYSYVSTSVVGVAGGVASLDGTGKVPASQLPAGTGGGGGGAVSTVAGRTGDVVLTKADVGLSSVNNTADSAKPVSTAQATADSNVQAFAIQRANHTGVQAISTITGLQTALDAKGTSSLVIGTIAGTAADAGALATSLAGKQATGDYATNTALALKADASSVVSLTAGDARYIRTVNGTGPDGTGNVTVAAGASVSTVTFDVRSYVNAGETLYKDGSVSVSTIFQRAHNAASTSGALAFGVPVVVYVPNGLYRLDVALAWATRVGILGESRAGVILLPYGDQSAITAIGSPSSPLTDCQFSNFTIDGTNQTNASYQTSIKGIFIQFMLRPVFRNLTIKNTWATGLGVDFLQDYIIEGNLLDNCGRGILATGASRDSALGGSGIGIGTGAYAIEAGIVANNIAMNNGVHGIFFERQVPAKTGVTPSFLSKGVRVVGNQMRNNWYGFRDAGCTNIEVIGNQMTGNQKAGVTLDKTTLSGTSGIYGTIANNVISENGVGDTSGGGIVIGYADGGNYTFSDNRIYGNTGFGVRMLATASTTYIGDFIEFVDNQIHGNTRSGIYLGTSSVQVTVNDLLLKDNRLWGNGTDTASTQRSPIYIDSSTARLRISENLAEGSPTYGLILANARTATDLTVWGNDLRNNTTPGLSNAHTTAGVLLVQNLGDFAAGGYTDEQAQDAIAAMFAAGTMSGITFTYDDANNKMNVTASGGGGGGTIAAGSILGDHTFADLATTPLTAQTTATNVDGVAITFTVPASGSVKYRFVGTAFLSGSSGTTGAQLSVFDTTTSVYHGADHIVTTTTAKIGVATEWIVTGLTPGATVNAVLRYKSTTLTLAITAGSLLEAVAL